MQAGVAQTGRMGVTTAQNKKTGQSARARVPARRRAPAASRASKKPTQNKVTLEMPERFINRELSWLAFNQRVVEEADNPRNPLLERLRFLSISASNLDEFYSVRVAGLVGQVREGLVALSPDGLTPAQQLDAVRERCAQLLREQQRIWVELRGLLAEEGVVLCEPADLDEADRTWLHACFMDRVFPVLTPLAVDPAHPLPFIPNMGLALGLRLLLAENGAFAMNALILLPAQVERFIRLPGKEGAESKAVRFIRLEDLITLCMDSFSPDLWWGKAGCCAWCVIPMWNLRMRRKTLSAPMKVRSNAAAVGWSFIWIWKSGCRPNWRTP